MPGQTGAMVFKAKGQKVVPLLRVAAEAVVGLFLHLGLLLEWVAPKVLLKAHRAKAPLKVAHQMLDLNKWALLLVPYLGLNL